MCFFAQASGWPTAGGGFSVAILACDFSIDARLSHIRKAGTARGTGWLFRLFVYEKTSLHPDQGDLPAQNSGPPEWSQTVFSLLLYFLGKMG